MYYTAANSNEKHYTYIQTRNCTEETADQLPADVTKVFDNAVAQVLTLGPLCGIWAKASILTGS